MKQKYAFVDRDGTLIFEPPDTYQIDSLDKLRVLDGAIDKLKELSEKGYSLVMISNQDGLGTSSFPKADFDSAQNEMIRLLKEQGVVFEKILICPHFPVDDCECRKPKTGLVKSWEESIDKEDSIVIGDRNTDMQFARNLGIRGVKVPTNEGLDTIS